MTEPRRLDHIAIAVRDTDAALEYFCGRLGLSVASSEILETPALRLTYLDCGNAFIQLVEPLDDASAVAESLALHGEGLHHICFGVDNAVAEAIALADPGAPPPTVGQGRGRRSVFVPGPVHHGVRIECTEHEPFGAEHP